tara:strand:+ start:425 stop:2095 length:1671 start_codon:yes stop_codon:yes gene_type:complete
MNKQDLEIKQIITLAYENHRKNNLRLAESLYKKILKIDTKYFDAIFLLGTLLLQKKNYEESIKLFHQALEIRPNDANTNNNLGHAYVQTAEAQKAKLLFKKAIEIQPEHADAYYNLANVHKHFGEFIEAEKYYKQSIAVKPNNPKAHNNLGNILKELGKFDEAISSYNKAIEIQFNHANAYHNLGHTYKQLGKFEDAKKYYKISLQHNPTNLETFSVLSDLNKEVISVDTVNKVKKIMEIKNISKKDIAYGNFVLAKHEFQQGNFEKELEFLQKGHSNYFSYKNKLFQKGLNYWLKEVPENNELLNLGKNNKTLKNEKIKPIFIVGVPRCGSTMIEKVLASGPKKIPIGEETAIISFEVGEHISQKKSISNNIQDFANRVIKRYEQKKLLGIQKENIFTDKSLDNFFFIGLIREIFPDAKIINCERNSLSSIVSILKNNLGDVAWAHDVKNIFNFFDIYHKKIEYFKKKFPNYIYELKLEEFVKEPEAESKKLMEFCDLPWSKECLEFYKRKDLTSRTASNVQIRQPIFRDTQSRQIPYEQLLSKYGNKFSWFNKK